MTKKLKNLLTGALAALVVISFFLPLIALGGGSVSLLGWISSSWSGGLALDTILWIVAGLLALFTVGLAAFRRAESMGVVAGVYNLLVILNVFLAGGLLAGEAGAEIVAALGVGFWLFAAASLALAVVGFIRERR